MHILALFRRPLVAMATGILAKQAFSGRLLPSEYKCEVWFELDIFEGNYVLLKTASDKIGEKEPKITKCLSGKGLIRPGCSDSLTTITCLLYTSPSPRDGLLSRMPSSA